MSFNPLVSLAVAPLEIPVLQAVMDADGPLTLAELACIVEEDPSIVAASLKRLEAKGAVVLDSANHLVLPPEA